MPIKRYRIRIVIEGYDVLGDPQHEHEVYDVTLDHEYEYDEDARDAVDRMLEAIRGE